MALNKHKFDEENQETSDDMEEVEDGGLDQLVAQINEKATQRSQLSVSEEAPDEHLPKSPNPMSKNSRNREKGKRVINGDGEKKRVATVWSEDDEIALLQGMVDYPLEKGVDPYEDMGGFFEYVKGFIHFDVQRRQVTDKLWKFRSKYLRNEFVVSKPHDNKLFEIAKKIESWGGVSEVKSGGGKGMNKKKRRRGVGDDNVARVSENGEKKDVKEENLAKEVNGNEVMDFCTMFPLLSHSFEAEMSFHSSLRVDVKDFVEERIRLIGREKAKELEERWNDLQLEEFEIYAKKTKLMSEQINGVLDGVGAS